MTGPRFVLLILAVLALVDGAWIEAFGVALFVLVLCCAWPGGIFQRPVPFTVWWPGGRWRDR